MLSLVLTAVLRRFSAWLWMLSKKIAREQTAQEKVMSLGGSLFGSIVRFVWSARGFDVGDGQTSKNS